MGLASCAEAMTQWMGSTPGKRRECLMRSHWIWRVWLIGWLISLVILDTPKGFTGLLLYAEWGTVGPVHHHQVPDAHLLKPDWTSDSKVWGRNGYHSGESGNKAYLRHSPAEGLSPLHLKFRLVSLIGLLTCTHSWPSNLVVGHYKLFETQRPVSRRL